MCFVPRLSYFFFSGGVRQRPTAGEKRPKGDNPERAGITAGLPIRGACIQPSTQDDRRCAAPRLEGGGGGGERGGGG